MKGFHCFKRNPSSTKCSNEPISLFYERSLVRAMVNWMDFIPTKLGFRHDSVIVLKLIELRSDPTSFYRDWNLFVSRKMCDDPTFFCDFVCHDPTNRYQNVSWPNTLSPGPSCTVIWGNFGHQGKFGQTLFFRHFISFSCALLNIHWRPCFL